MGMTKELSVPIDAFLEFAQLVGENNVLATIDGADEDDDSVTVTLEYGPDERATIHHIEDFVEDKWLEIEEEDDEDDD